MGERGKRVAWEREDGRERGKAEIGEKEVKLRIRREIGEMNGSGVTRDKRINEVKVTNMQQKSRLCGLSTTSRPVLAVL